MKKGLKLFSNSESVLTLNPSFEPTNFEESKDRHQKPYCNKENCDKFRLLLELYKSGLVAPVEAPNMYETAMQSKTCKLTKLGQYYKELSLKDKI